MRFSLFFKLTHNFLRVFVPLLLILRENSLPHLYVFFCVVSFTCLLRCKTSYRTFYVLSADHPKKMFYSPRQAQTTWRFPYSKKTWKRLKMSQSRIFFITLCAASRSLLRIFNLKISSTLSRCGRIKRQENEFYVNSMNVDETSSETKEREEGSHDDRKWEKRI